MWILIVALINYCFATSDSEWIEFRWMRIWMWMWIGWRDRKRERKRGVFPLVCSFYSFVISLPLSFTSSLSLSLTAENGFHLFGPSLYLPPPLPSFVARTNRDFFIIGLSFFQASMPHYQFLYPKLTVSLHVKNNNNNR